MTTLLVPHVVDGRCSEIVSQVSVIANDQRERGDLSSGTVLVAGDCCVASLLATTLSGANVVTNNTSGTVSQHLAHRTN
jgi:hypothetical protein